MNGPDSWPESEVNSRYSLETSGEYLEVKCVFYHICNGYRPGGYFLQKEAWQAVNIARDSTTRAVLRVVGST